VIAVTGATGFIGRYLCQHFRRLGWEVRALARNIGRYPFDVEGITLHHCDLPDIIDQAAFEGSDAIIHCAYMTRFTDLAAAERVNEAGTRRVIEAARAAGVGRLVFLSSQSAHGRAVSYYGRSKLALERLFYPEDVVLRPGLVIGRTGHSLFHRICGVMRRATVVPLFDGGRQPVQTVHVDDLCRAVEQSLEKGLCGTYTVAAPGCESMGLFLREIAVRLGRRPLFVPVPMAPALAMFRAIERLGLPFPLSSENLLGLKCLCAIDTRGDLAALGLDVRSTRESLDEALGEGRRLRRVPPVSNSSMASQPSTPRRA
jgi:NADH dehydrogenase